MIPVLGVVLALCISSGPKIKGASGSDSIQLKSSSLASSDHVVVVLSPQVAGTAIVSDDLTQTSGSLQISASGELDLGQAQSGIFKVSISIDGGSNYNELLVITGSDTGFDVAMFDLGSNPATTIGADLTSRIRNDYSVDLLKHAASVVFPGWIAAHSQGILVNGGTWVACFVPSLELSCAVAARATVAEAADLTSAVFTEAINEMPDLSDDEKGKAKVFFGLSNTALQFVLADGAASKAIAVVVGASSTLVDNDTYTLSVSAAGDLVSKYQLAWTILKK